jgi:hypothetical protein
MDLGINNGTKRHRKILSLCMCSFRISVRNLYGIARVVSEVPKHEDVGGSETIPPRILQLCSKWM